MNNRQKWALSAIVAVVAVAGIILIKQAPKNSATNPASQAGTGQSKTTFNPDFVLGIVVKAQSDQIEFKSGSNTDFAKISATTKLLKQVKVGTELKTVAATLTDFKAGQMITVYPKVAPMNNVYATDRVLILSQ